MLIVMPLINLKPIREKKIEYKHEDNSSKFYNSLAWHRLRGYFFKMHPLCSCCLLHDVVKPAENIHHKKPFLRGKTEEEQWKLFLDEHNLMSVCRSCHDKLHLKGKRYKIDVLDTLTDKEYNENIYKEE